MPVGRGLGDCIGADDAAGAGPVVDDNGLAERLLEIRLDQSRDRVVEPARRERDDNADGPVRIGLGWLDTDDRERAQEDHRAPKEPQSHPVHSRSLARPGPIVSAWPGARSRYKRPFHTGSLVGETPMLDATRQRYNVHDRPHADLREFIARADSAGELLRVKGAAPELEVGTLAEIVSHARPEPPAILFEDV